MKHSTYINNLHVGMVTVGDKSEIETNSSFVSENKQSKSHSLGGVND